MAYSWKDDLPDGGALPENTDIAPLATLTASDDGGVDAVSYSITNHGHGNLLFEIDDNGILSPTAYLGDYENSLLDPASESRHFSAIVNAYSAEGEVVASRLFVLTLGDVDEFETEWVGTPPTSIAIDENNPENLGLAVFYAADGDGTADVTYSLSGSDAAYFTTAPFNGGGGLYLKSSLDYEDSSHADGLYSVIVTATSTDGSDAISTLYVLTVVDVNEPVAWQTNPTGNAGEVLENIAIGTSLADFDAIDPEGTATVNYSVQQYPDAEYFEIDSEGVLTTRSGLDFEDGNAGHYTVLVRAQADDDIPLIQQVFVLTVTNVADADADWVDNPAGIAIDENNAENFGPIVFNAVDKDGAAVTYSLEPSTDTAPNDAAYFNLDANTGELSVKSSLNFENPDHDPAYSVIINATSTDGSPAISQIFILTVNDVDEAVAWQAGGNPTGNAGEVLENIAIGTSVADFGSSDPEGGAAYYGLGSDYGFDGGHQDAYFNLDLNSGELTTNSVLNFEEFAHYTILALSQAAAGNKGVASQLFVLTLGDVAEDATWVDNPASIAIDENNSENFGPIVFNATDRDGAAVTYSLEPSTASAPNDAAYFNLDANTGELRVKSVLDYENPDHAPTYSVIINATSTDGSPAISQIFILTVNDVEEAVAWQTGGNPTGNAGEVLETVAIGTSLADFGATDGDAGATVNYSVDQYPTAAYFEIDSTTGVLTTRSELDFEDGNAGHYTVLVKAQSDDGSPLIQQVFVLTVTNVDEFETVWTSVPPTSIEIAENNPENFGPIAFNATDGDGVAVTYSLSGDDAAYFNIDANTGGLYVKSSLNFEDPDHTAQFYNVIINATSTDGSTISTLYVLSLSDITNEFTQWEAGGNPTGNAGEVLENIAIGTTLADFNAIDPEGTATLNYSVQQHDNAAYFEIDSTTGVLTTRSGLDFEDGNAGHYTVIVDVKSDDGSPDISQTFILTVTNVADEDAAWVSNPAGIEIAENNPENFGPIAFNATDRDGAAVTYSLEPSTDTAPNDAAYFNLDANTGELSVKSVLNFEDPDHGITYSVIINATSTDGSPAVSQAFILTVTDVDEQVAWQTNPTGNAGEVLENMAIGTSVANFGSSDPEGAGLAYYGLGSDYGFAGGHQDAYFKLDLQTGELTTNSELNFEEFTHYTILALSQAAVGDKGVAEHTFILTLGDVADETLEWVSTPSTVGRKLAENDTTTTTIADFGATDTVDATPLTYSLSGTDSADFAIDAATGILSTAGPFNFEDADHTDGLYSVIITATATDGTGTPAISRRYVLTITDVDEQVAWQTNPTGNAGEVLETIAIGTSVADFDAIDPEGAGTAYYGLGSDYGFDGGHQDAYFNLDLSTGELTTNSVLDFEEFTHYTILALSQAAEGNKGVASQLFILTITDQDIEWESGGNPTGNAIAENNPAATLVADFGASDTTDNSTLTYSLAAGGDSANFAIDAATGELSTSSSFNFEDSHDPRYSVVVIATETDAAAGAVSQTFILTINDVDEQVAWQTAPTGNAGEVLETIAIGTSVADFDAIDPEGGAAYYGLGSDYGFDGGHQDAYFNLDLQTGELTTNSVLDFEEFTHYTILALSQAAEGNKGVASQLFILTITDQDIEWESGGNPTGNAIAENNPAATLIADFGASDTTDNSTLTYSLAAGGDSANFAIDAATGELTTSSSFNFEDSHDPRYSVVVIATETDAAAGAVSQTFILTINDVDEQVAWQTAPTGNAGEVLETIAIGTSVADFGATDPEGAGTAYYGLGSDYGFDSGHQDAYFNLDLSTGELTTNSELNFEEFTHYTILALSQAAEGNKGVASQLFILTLADVSEDTIWVNNPAGITIAENNPENYGPIVFNATDGDAVAVTYSLSGDDVDYFDLNANTGELRVKSILNFEDTDHGATYSVIINATSTDGSAAVSQAFILTVTDVDVEPTQWEAGGNPTGNAGEVLETIAIGTSLADFGATDPEGTATLSYSVQQYPTAAYFEIDSTTGVLTTRSGLDFETQEHYSVIVQVQSDDGSPDISQHFVLTVTNVDDVATDWVGTPLTGISIAENNPENLGPIVFNATDGDSGATVTYSLEPSTDSAPNDAAYFNLDANTGELFVKSVLDFENPDHGIFYSVIINATSTDGSTAVSTLFTLSLGNDGDPITWDAGGNPTGNTVAENNIVGASIADFGATDGDLITTDENGTEIAVDLTYSIVSGYEQYQYFNIDAATGVLTAASVLDFEEFTHYTVGVQVDSNDGSLAIQQAFILTITDTSDFPVVWTDDPRPNPTKNDPIVAIGTSLTISENNTVGATLVDFDATDGDGGATVTYSLQSGADDVYFSINAETGTLHAASQFNFEDPNQVYSVIIVATSTDSDSATRTFVLTVGDVNDPITWGDDNQVTAVLNENNSINATVFDFNAIAGSDNASISYSLQADTNDTDAGYFNINADTGVLIVTSTLDHEEKTTYSVVVIAHATDASPSISQLFVLSTGNENDNPTTWVDNLGSSVISENNTVGASLANFTATDPDNQTITYTLQDDGVDNDYFNLDAGTGVLTLAAALDFEDSNHGNNYTVVIIASNIDDTAISTLYVLSVANISEFNATWETDGNPTGTNLSENNSIGVQVADFNATDGDRGMAVTYSLESGADTAYFSINADGGTLSLRSELDFESTTHANTYSVVVIAQSVDGGPATSQLFVLSLQNENEFTTGWTNNGNPSTFAVTENTDVGTGLSIADFNATDGDAVTVTYSLQSGNDTAYFNITAATGILTFVSELDYEHQANYSVTVLATATDDGAAATQLFILSLGNVADLETEWASQSSGNSDINENNNAGVSVALFSAFDGDGFDVTYSLTGNDIDYFNFNATTGVLSLTSSLNFEDKEDYSVLVTATSTDGEAISQLFVVSLNDLAEPITWQQDGNPSYIHVEEELAPGTSIADFGAIDGDGAVVTYLLSAPAHSNQYILDVLDSVYFSINADTGILSLRSSLNFEGQLRGARYTLVVTATSDDSSPDITQQLIVTIVNVDEDPITWPDPYTDANGFAINAAGASITENNVAPDANNPSKDIGLAQFRANDTDATYINYQILGGDSAQYFQLVSNRLEVANNVIFDYETNPYHSIIIRATSPDGFNESITRLFILTVGDEDDPTDWTSSTPPASANLAENSGTNISVADFTATDGDGATVTYSLSGTDANAFNIDATSGVLTVKSDFDYEDSAVAAKNYTYNVVITAKSTDESEAITTPFQLKITNVIDGGSGTAWEDNGNPTGRELAENNFTVGGGPRDNANFFLADFNATDSEGRGDFDVTYAISGDQEEYFVIQKNKGGLRLRSGFDFENPRDPGDNNHYTVVVTATAEADGDAISQLYILTITDGDDPITWTRTDDLIFLYENGGANALVYDFNANDPDAGTTLNYTLSGADASYFNVNSSNGVVTAKANFDYEGDDETARPYIYKLRITANSDDASSAIHQNFDVKLLNGSGVLAVPHAPLDIVNLTLNDSILFDGTTDIIGGINDGVGVDGLAITGENLSVTQYDSVSATNTDLIITNAENFEQSFVGYTDADGNTQNHWFFVRDDAEDNTGHIVFDADGLDVNLDALSNGGANTTPDQINLLAALNGNDGDFNKPDDLDLNLNNNSASALTHDQFLALIGGSNNIDFV